MLVASHQGLGDHILCNGLYRSLSMDYEKVVIPVKSKNFDSVKRMLSDLDNVQIVRIADNLEKWFMRFFVLRAKIVSTKTVLLGKYGIDFFLDGVRFDENFYIQAQIPFEYRWENFLVVRDQRREEALFARLGCGNEPYIFLHEDPARGFLIDKSKLPGTHHVVRPLPNPNEFSLFEYRLVLENAVEIHVIESAFAAFIESMNLNVAKFAHRYARPEASSDFRSEFTYRSKWEIIS